MLMSLGEEEVEKQGCDFWIFYGGRGDRLAWMMGRKGIADFLFFRSSLSGCRLRSFRHEEKAVAGFSATFEGDGNSPEAGGSKRI